MFLEWIVLYAVSVPLGYAAWVLWGKNYPKLVVLHDLNQNDEPVELRRAA